MTWNSLHVCHLIAVKGKADLGLTALTSSIYEHSLASCAFTRCTALTPMHQKITHLLAVKRSAQAAGALFKPTGGDGGIYCRRVSPNRNLQCF